MAANASLRDNRPSMDDLLDGQEQGPGLANSRGAAGRRGRRGAQAGRGGGRGIAASSRTRNSRGRATTRTRRGAGSDRAIAEETAGVEGDARSGSSTQASRTLVEGVQGGEDTNQNGGEGSAPNSSDKGKGLPIDSEHTNEESAQDDDEAPVSSPVERSELAVGRTEQRRTNETNAGRAYLGLARVDMSYALDDPKFQPNRFNLRQLSPGSTRALVADFRRDGVNYFSIPRIRFAIQAGAIANRDLPKELRDTANIPDLVLNEKAGTTLQGAMLLAGQHRRHAVLQICKENDKALASIRARMAANPDSPWAKSVAPGIATALEQEKDQIRYWFVEVYDIEILLGAPLDKPNEHKLDAIMHLCKNANETVVPEKPRESWTMALLSVLNTVRQSTPPGALVTEKQAIEAAESLKVKDRRGTDQNLYKVTGHWSLMLVLTLLLIDQGLINIVGNPAWVNKHMLDNYGRMLTSVIMDCVSAFHSVLQSGDFRTADRVDRDFQAHRQHLDEVASWEAEKEEAARQRGPRPDPFDDKEGARRWLLEGEEYERLNPRPTPTADATEWAKYATPFREPVGRDDVVRRLVSSEKLVGWCSSAFRHAFLVNRSSMATFGQAQLNWREVGDSAMARYERHLLREMEQGLRAAADEDGGVSEGVVRQTLESMAGRLRYWLWTISERGGFVGLVCPRMLTTLANELSRVGNALKTVWELIEPFVEAERETSRAPEKWHDRSNGVYEHFKTFETHPDHRGIGAEEAWWQLCIFLLQNMFPCLAHLEKAILENNVVDMLTQWSNKSSSRSPLGHHDVNDPDCVLYRTLGWDARGSLDYEALGIPRLPGRPSFFSQMDHWFQHRYPGHVMKQVNPRARNAKLFTGSDLEFHPGALAASRSAYMVKPTSHDQRARLVKRASACAVAAIRHVVDDPRVLTTVFMEERLRNPIRDLLRRFWGSPVELWDRTFMEKNRGFGAASMSREPSQDELRYGVLIEGLEAASRRVDTVGKILSLAKSVFNQPSAYVSDEAGGARAEGDGDGDGDGEENEDEDDDEDEDRDDYDIVDGRHAREKRKSRLAGRPLAAEVLVAADGLFSALYSNSVPSTFGKGWKSGWTLRHAASRKGGIAPPRETSGFRANADGFARTALAILSAIDKLEVVNARASEVQELLAKLKDTGTGNGGERMEFLQKRLALSLRFGEDPSEGRWDLALFESRVEEVRRALRTEILMHRRELKVFAEAAETCLNAFVGDSQSPETSGAHMDVTNGSGDLLSPDVTMRDPGTPDLGMEQPGPSVDSVPVMGQDLTQRDRQSYQVRSTGTPSSPRSGLLWPSPSFQQQPLPSQDETSSRDAVDGPHGSKRTQTAAEFDSVKRRRLNENHGDDHIDREEYRSAQSSSSTIVREGHQSHTPPNAVAPGISQVESSANGTVWDARPGPPRTRRYALPGSSEVEQPTCA